MDKKIAPPCSLVGGSYTAISIVSRFLLGMASTQTPPNPPDRPLEPRSENAKPRYESYEHHELLSMIDDLEEERWRARVREGIWVSVILHLLIFWFIIYGPHVLFHRPYVVDPLKALAQRDKQLTYLNLPPDALKMKPKRSDVISDQNHVAQSAHPTLDKKTLEELQAMRRAGNSAPPPAPQPQQQQQKAQQQPAPQQQEMPSAPKPQPQDQAQLNEPPAPRPNITQNQNAPQKTKSSNSAAAPTMSVGDMIRQAEKSAAQNHNFGQAGDNGAGAPADHPGMHSGVEVLSDTMGVDFGPYIKQVIQATQNSWDLLIPEAARPPLRKQGKVAIQFIITPDGNVKQMQLIFPSGDVSLDRAAWGGITGAAPFGPLPKEFKGPYLALRFYFLYNQFADGSAR